MPTETIPFEILGHFQEIIDIETGKCYGTYPVAYLRLKENYSSFAQHRKDAAFLKEPPAYGYSGRRECLFKKGEIIMIDKHHKGMQLFRFKADAKCWVITHPICGRIK